MIASCDVDSLLPFIRHKLAEDYRLNTTHPTDLPGRKAAVLVPFCCRDGKLQVIFTRRTELVLDHKGQVAFPGGAMEPEDADTTVTALRECFEEIGIPPEEVDILGKMKDYWTISNFVISPVIGLTKWRDHFETSPNEVSRVFSVPVDFLTDVKNIEVERRTLPNGMDLKLFYYAKYDGEIVWGITARIAVRLMKALDWLPRDL